MIRFIVVPVEVTMTARCDPEAMTYNVINSTNWDIRAKKPMAVITAAVPEKLPVYRAIGSEIAP